MTSIRRFIIYKSSRYRTRAFMAAIRQPWVEGPWWVVRALELRARLTVRTLCGPAGFNNLTPSLFSEDLMVQPVTGPYSSQELSYGPPNALGQRTYWFEKTRVWHRQRKPYNLPLPFSVIVRQIDGFNHTNADGQLSFNQCSSLVDPAVWNPDGAASERSFNRARAALIADLKPAQAELGAAIGEWRSSIGMITRRSLQLARAVGAIRRFRFNDAARILGMSTPPSRAGLRKRTKSFADNLLEYRFGWAPLCRDIEQALKALTGGLPSYKVHGRGVDRGVWATDTGVVSGTRQTTSGSYISSHRISARVGAINPNLVLANQLGLVNPASVVWELVSLSFLVDYLANVGQFLGGFTDTLGYDLLDVNWTWRATSSSHDSVQWQIGTSSPQTADWTAHKMELRRDVSPLPGFFFTTEFKNVFRPTYDREGNLNAPWRAATTIALLLQKLR